MAHFVNGAAQPAWAGEAGTTRQVYQFTTSSLSPEPEIRINPYGNPVAGITVSSPFGTGWQDPEYAFSTPGVNADGAWDIGPDGQISVLVPVAPPVQPGISYRVEFHVYLVAYEVPVALPAISLPGLSPENVSSSTQVVKQETLGRYTGLTWQAEADLPAANSVVLSFTAGAPGAVIDSIEIHTRYVAQGNPVASYGEWLTRHFPGESDPAVIGFDASPDGDSIANGVKYFLGSGRLATGHLLAILDADASALILRHSRNKSTMPDISAAYEWSLDLSSWHGDGAIVDGFSVSFSAVVSDSAHPLYDWMTVTASMSPGTPGPVFVRLKVEPTSSSRS